MGFRLPKSFSSIGRAHGVPCSARLNARGVIRNARPVGNPSAEGAAQGTGSQTGLAGTHPRGKAHVKARPHAATYGAFMNALPRSG